MVMEQVDQAGIQARLAASGCMHAGRFVTKRKREMPIVFETCLLSEDLPAGSEHACRVRTCLSFKNSGIESESGFGWSQTRERALKIERGV
jgi:hypothetical protein